MATKSLGRNYLIKGKTVVLDEKGIKARKPVNKRFPKKNSVKVARKGQI